ncbi:MAG: efflux RND transporter periplasmic adaptor subunit [Pseudomonadales bacterium]|nr:efflux RND transporter periplasmic adaptor subunit [Pseudomonadales bacterium]
MSAGSKFAQVAAWLAGKRLLGIAVLFAGIIVATLIVATGPEAAPRAREEKAWPVSVVSVEPGSRNPTVIAFGRVESRQVANLTTSVGAPVESVLAPEGTWVNEGDVLIRLSHVELELAVRRAESEYKRRVAVLKSVQNQYASAKRTTDDHKALAAIAEAKLHRHEELYKNRMISDTILDEARQQASERAIALEQHMLALANFPSLIDQNEAAVAEAKALLDKAELDLAQAEIRAPFSGRVIKTMVAPGDRIMPGEALVSVADYSRLELRTSLPARVGDTLRRTESADGKVHALGEVDGKIIDFVLDRLSGDVKAGQGGLDAFFRPVADVQLDLGRVVSLAISLPAQPDVVALPLESLYENDRIYRVEGNRLQGISVENVGDYLTDDGGYQVLVRSPEIHKGDRVITTQLPRAITGLLVEPTDGARFESAIAADHAKSGEAATP